MSDRHLLRVVFIFLVLACLALAPIFVEAAHCQPLIVPQAVFVGASMADIHSTHRAVTSGRGSEGNPFMGDGIGATPLLFKSAGVAATLYLTHELHKTHPRLATITLYSLTAVLAGVSYRNYRIARGV